MNKSNAYKSLVVVIFHSFLFPEFRLVTRRKKEKEKKNPVTYNTDIV